MRNGVERRRQLNPSASPDFSSHQCHSALLCPGLHRRGHTAFHEHSDSLVFQIHRHERQPGGNRKSGLGPAIGLSRPGLSGDERRLRAGANLRRHRHVQRCANGDSRRLWWQASVTSVSAMAWKLSPGRQARRPETARCCRAPRLCPPTPTNTVPPAANFASEAGLSPARWLRRWLPCT